MANGNMGKKVPEATRLRAIELVSKGNTFASVAQRLGISTAYIRKLLQAEQERLAINQEAPDDCNNDAGEPSPPLNLDSFLGVE